MIKVNIGIRGAYGEQNFGDDALMLFLYKWSLNNNLDINFIGRDSSYVYNLISKEKYILKTKSHRYHFEKLILGGGTQFFSFDKTPKKENKFKLFFSNPHEFFLKLKYFIEKKFIYKQLNYDEIFSVGIGLGPFVSNSKQEILASEQILLMKGLYVRDNYSFNYAKSINANSFLGTDICFLPDIYNFKKYQKISNEIKRIGIIVRDWNYSEVGGSYLKEVLKYTKKLSEDGYEIEFICFKDEPNSEKEIIDLGFKIVKWNPLEKELEDFVQVLSTFDLFISARFHGIIFGALLNIPSIAIEVEPKLRVTKELLKEGVEIWEQPFNKDLANMVKNFKYEEAIKSLNFSVKTQQEKAKKMFHKLYEDIS